MEVLIRDASGYIHRRFRYNGSYELTYSETDDSNEVGEYEEIEEYDLADVALEAWCKRCFEMVLEDK